MHPRQLLKRLWEPLLILLVAILSAYKTLGFYFWHDDFSVLYAARIGECSFKWPYGSYCSIFGFLDRFLNYSAFSYFLLGLLLFIFTSLSLFYFYKQLVLGQVAFLLALIFSTGYIGAGTFLEAYDSITLFLSLGIFFLSLAVLSSFFKNNLKPGLFVFAIVLFALSLIILHARSFAYVFAWLAFIFLFPRKMGMANKLFIALVSLLVFLLFYFLIPLGLTVEWAGGELIGSLRGVSILQKFGFFLQNLGALVLTDEMRGLFAPDIDTAESRAVLTVIGMLMVFVFLYFLAKQRRKSHVFKLRIYALLWIVFQYLPYSLRSDWLLGSTSRYILPAFPGVLLAWSSFSEKKYWKTVTILLVILGVLETNVFFERHLRESENRKDFYAQLHRELPTIPEGAILFFNFPQRIVNKTNDFFRVGSRPPESALGTEYIIDYKKLKLVTESELFARKISQGEVEAEKLFTFYYDGEKLTSTTANSRINLTSLSLISQKIGMSQTMNFVEDRNLGQWAGANAGVGFKVEDFQALLPYAISIQILASPPELLLPYTQGRYSYKYDPGFLRRSLEYLTTSTVPKRALNIEASDSGEDTTADALFDFNSQTQWLGNRQQWHKGKKPVLTLTFSQGVSFDGIILYTGARRKPSKFELVVGDTVVNHKSEDFDKGIKILAQVRDVKSIDIRILNTVDNDSPVIYEIDIIPTGFSDIDIDKVKAVGEFPAAMIRSKEDRDVLYEYLASGAKACLEWEAPGYGTGIVNFDLFVDGRTHEYDVQLPATGLVTPTFRLGCLNYPVNIWVEQVTIRFLGN